MATIEELLAQNETSELLRFSTAGSVDDGKSTLIGRLLYDCKSVYEDQLDSVKNSRINRSGRAIDFSLLTDGLRAEREQGITIDVAYRYFQTPRRKFIIADTPGHEQYTRNMATGASTASLAVILIDARKGLLPQSKRHAYISILLGIPNLVAAVNKMDLVDFRQDVYDAIKADFEAFCARLGRIGITSIPMSALDGDNVVSKSARTPWYAGPPLLEHLETVPFANNYDFTSFRLPVQYVIRPDLDFRGFAGSIAAGTLRKGARVMSLPSGRTSKVKEIVAGDASVEVAFAPMAVCVTLEDEIDISRGDMLVDPARMPHVSRRFDASLVWMSAEPLDAAKVYLLKHTAHQVQARITAVQYRIDVDNLSQSAADSLGLNEIGVVTVEATHPVFFDAYKVSRWTGSFILIDSISNATVAAGMIEEPRNPRARRGTAELSRLETGRVTVGERIGRSGHLPVTIWLTSRSSVAWLVERRLFDRGCAVRALADDDLTHLLPEMASVLNGAGVIAVCSEASEEPGDLADLRSMIGEHNLIRFEPGALPPDDNAAADLIIAELGRRHVFPSPDFAAGEGI
jgi:sulfate adenylyltransferase large subunit